MRGFGWVRRIGILTSGGDAPGMNACIRAVVRYALHHGCEVVGIFNGLRGLAEVQFRTLTRLDTVNIIGRGGTILGTSRYPDFLDPSVQQRCAENLWKEKIEGLILCGGEGSLKAAHTLWNEYGINVVGVPATIDNDIPGIDYCLGFDTAVNTAMEAIDKIRDTAESHGRLFFVEVMGRWSGYIALFAGLATGAEYIALPEVKTDLDVLYRFVQRVGPHRRIIIIVAEGDEKGGAQAYAAYFRDNYQIDSRVTLLGHIQRGGPPSARDRIVGSLFGKAAVDLLLQQKYGVFVGLENNLLVHRSLSTIFDRRVAVPQEYVELATVLV